MHTNRLILIVLALVMSLAGSACAAGQAAAPTLPPTLTLTPLPPTATATEPATPTPVPPTSTPKSDKQIKLIPMEKNQPAANKTLWFSYYDESTKAWVTSSGVTGPDGMVIFTVPEGQAGESYTFTFGYSEAEVNKNTKNITGGMANGFRIPPDPSQKSLTLKLYGVDVSVEEGSIQMWQPK